MRVSEGKTTESLSYAIATSAKLPKGDGYDGGWKPPLRLTWNWFEKTFLIVYDIRASERLRSCAVLTYLERDNFMKKHLLALGTFLTSLVLFGCSGTPENSAQGPNPLEGGSTTSESLGEISVSNSAKIPLAADAETVRIGSIDWYVNYDDALADAKKTNRPVWLHFGENPG